VSGSAETRDPDGLQSLRDSVRQFWIERVLQRSVRDDLQLEVTRVTQMAAVANPLSKVARLPRQASQLLPPGQSMGSLFTDAGRALLILGHAGSGKTISLLELASDLMDRADGHDGDPVPVVFNLSTWAGHTPLLDWLLEELKSMYFVPAEDGRTLLKGHFVVLLLDGLDEVRAESRAACVEAINEFVRETGVRGIAVCCRTEEYDALPARLTLRGAVALQPLTLDQVDEYLSRADPGLAALRAHLHTDPQLQELAQTPLMLNVMSVAYKGLTPQGLSATALQSVEERREHLFTSYVEEMFDRSDTEKRLRAPIIRGVSWLARQMRAHAQSMFLIEGLQPDWLRTPTERRAYIMASRVLCGAVLGIVFGAILHVTWGTFAPGTAGPLAEGMDLLTKLAVGLGLGSLNGILIGFMDIWRFERQRPAAVVPGHGKGSRVIVEVAGYTLVLALLNGLLVGIVDKPETGVIIGIIVGPAFGLFFGMHGVRRDMSNDVRTVEALHWSWTGLRRSAGRGLFGGIAVGILVGLMLQLADRLQERQTSAAESLNESLLMGVLGAVVGLVVGAALGSLESRIVTRKTTPNQGIELSARNAILAGVATGPMVGLLLGSAAAPILSAAQIANTALIGGLFFGMLAALRAGGFDVIQHYTLRVILAARGYTPLDYARFLDSAASLVFLLNAGGAYLFVHPLLLEYFAEGSEVGGPGRGLRVQASRPRIAALEGSL
jgi:eukaryotic-like serine/threonine-protein kinase